MKKYIALFLLSTSLMTACTLPEVQTQPVPSQVTITAEVKTILGRAGALTGQFLNPYGVTMGDGEEGLIYVTDSGNQRVQVFNKSGDFRFQFGSFGQGKGQFNNPTGITLSNGSVWVTDAGNQRVERFNWRGDYLNSLGSLGNDKNQFNIPMGIMVDDFNQRWIADAQNDRVCCFDSFDKPIIQIGSFGLGPGFLRHPVDVADDGFGQLIISDQGNHRIQIMTKEGDFVSQFGNEKEMAMPSGITLYKQQIIIVCDQGKDQIGFYQKNGQLIRTLSAPPLKSPTDVKVDSQGLMAVVDSGHNRIILYQLKTAGLK